MKTKIEHSNIAFFIRGIALNPSPLVAQAFCRQLNTTGSADYMRTLEILRKLLEGPPKQFKARTKALLSSKDKSEQNVAKAVLWELERVK